jgi:DNA end-binding protein Ku
MMRSIWNGSISFGLVRIPIKLVNATETRSIDFRQIHTVDGGRIRYRKVCELDDQEVSSAEIGKAYEAADGFVVPITDEDLAALPLPTAKTIKIVAFVPETRIDPLQMGKAYYLQANGIPAAKPYTLLREALKRSRRIAIAKYVLRGRERLGMLRVVGDAIGMHGLLWPDEVREPSGLAPDAKVSIRDAELDLADTLMDTLGEVDLDELHDDYREALEELIAAKAEGTMPESAEAPAEWGGKAIDLMAALESSVRAAKASRGESEEAAGSGEQTEAPQLPARERAAAKKTVSAPKKPTGRKSTASTASKDSAAKRAAARKSTAQKSTAKKATAKKATPRKRGSA